MSRELSYCGLDCENCAIREEVFCEGCKGTENTYWGGICEIKECAMKLQKVENCSFCKKFPCEILLDISFDPETGDDGARIERLKELSDNRLTMWDKIRPPLIGALIGGIVGLIIGLGTASYIIGFAVFGAAIALIIVINRRGE